MIRICSLVVDPSTLDIHQCLTFATIERGKLLCYWYDSSVKGKGEGSAQIDSGRGGHAPREEGLPLFLTHVGN